MTMRSISLPKLLSIPILICFIAVLYHQTSQIQAQSFSGQESMIGDGTLRRIRVPILMYHYVSPLPPDADEFRIALTLEPGIFREHLQYLKDQEYTSISLYDLHDALSLGKPLPPKSVILTFDDGYIEHYTTVYPLLKEYGFSGTFFIITGRADNNDPGYVSWNQIQEMSENGMFMESHTKSHSDLRERSYDFLVYEILGSIESLKAHTNEDVNLFCYPAGRYDDSTLEVLNTLPIWIAVTTQPGTLHTTDNMLELPRLRITNDTGVLGLAQLLNSRNQ